MKYWPIPDSYSKKLPKSGEAGSFWEDRKDRFHCGIDIYAPRYSKVLSIEDGEVIDTGIFTSPDSLHYWNTTQHIVIGLKDGGYCLYAELEDVQVSKGDFVNSGKIIGHVGQVLNKNKIGKDCPAYIQELVGKKHSSMLHFELYKTLPADSEKYLGGNWFEKDKPEWLSDPTELLASTLD
ncbi:MAG: M23 family metallopeptidase [Candidatus Thermoplasmatota archaeon]|nr:M23 family metallopeptidase [Candidatus Thermoplasmatota archaeon]